jgi:hypothetical protein
VCQCSSPLCLLRASHCKLQYLQARPAPVSIASHEFVRVLLAPVAVAVPVPAVMAMVTVRVVVMGGRVIVLMSRCAWSGIWL